MDNIIQKQYENQTISFDLTSDMLISLTDIAKANGKLTKDWLKLEYTKEFLNEYQEYKLPLNIEQILIVRHGGNNNGTGANQDIALEFARWCSPKFSIWINRTLNSLIESRVDVAKILKEIKVDKIEQSGFVYYIREVDTGNVKIGVSKNPESRLKQLQVGNSSRLELIKTEQYQDAYTEEKRLHLVNSDKHIQGEWFLGKVV